MTDRKEIVNTAQHEEAMEAISTLRKASIALNNLANKYDSNGLPFQVACDIEEDVRVLALNSAFVSEMIRKALVGFAEYTLTRLQNNG